MTSPATGQDETFTVKIPSIKRGEWITFQLRQVDKLYLRKYVRSDIEPRAVDKIGSGRATVGLIEASTTFPRGS